MQRQVHFLGSLLPCLTFRGITTYTVKFPLTDASPLDPTIAMRGSHHLELTNIDETAATSQHVPHSNSFFFAD